MTSARALSRFLIVVALLVSAAVAAENRPGRIGGRVTDPDGNGTAGVTVSIDGTDRATLTDAEGAYTFSGVPAGTYDLIFVMGENTLTEKGIVVTPGQTAQLDVTAVWDIGYAESVTVYAASRQVERIVDAPAAISVVGDREIQKQASHGQLPKLLEFAPGVEASQSGLYDYNFNTRGFNSSLNRRVATLIDGRDPSVPFLGSQEWAALSFPLDDLAGAELLRGPSAALYGKNAASGVLNLTTKQPRYSEGGMVRLTGGELDTTHLDFRWSSYVFADWYIKAVAGHRSSGDFAQSRDAGVEYSTPCVTTGQTDCLPTEVPLVRVDDNEITFGGLRIDKYWGGGATLTLEAGTADVKGPLFMGGIGRFQMLDVERPWARARWSDDHWNVQLNYTGRNAPQQLSLISGTNLALDTDRLGIEIQTHRMLAGDRLRLVGGGSYIEEEIDSRDPVTGLQTVLFEPLDADFTALFSQANYRISDRFEAVLAARWDDSSLHRSQVSPKAALVWTPAPDQTVRLTYNEAFQVGNYSELFLQVPASMPRDLSSAESICVGEMVDCGFGAGATPVLAVGNVDLELEKVRSWEIGWSGILNDSSFVTLDYYRGENDNFITDFLPQCGTPLGTCATPADRVNPNYGPYQPPASLSPAGRAALLSSLQTSLGPLFPSLSNNLDGAPIVAFLTYTNFGKVETQGADVSVNHFLNGQWNVQFAYSWFDFEITETVAGLDDVLLPNSPEHKASAGVRYVGDRLDGDLLVRWMDDFRWSVGIYKGDVDSFVTADLNLNYRLNEGWKAGVAVANLFDDVHYESFGGDLIGRRALGHVTFAW